MILKEYQKRTLATVRSFLERLAMWREKDRAARSQDPEWGFDWVERAWSQELWPGGPTTPAATDSARSFPPSASRSQPVAARRWSRYAGDRSRQRALPAESARLSAVDRAHDADLQPDTQGAQGPRPPVPPATRSGVGSAHPNLREDHGIRPARCGREPLRSPAHAAIGQPEDEGHSSGCSATAGASTGSSPPDDDPPAHAELLEERPNLDTFEQTTGFWGHVTLRLPSGNTIRLLRTADHS